MMAASRLSGNRRPARFAFFFAVPEPVQVLGYTGVFLPQFREVDEEVGGVEPIEDASGLGQLGEHLDRRHPGEEGGLVLEREEPGQVDEFEEIVVGAALDGALVLLVSCACRPVLFLGTASGVVGLEVGFVVCARRNLAVVQCTRQEDNLVLGVLEDGARGVAEVGAFE